MRVLYIFGDGREQECTLPLTFPLGMISTLMDSRNNQGIIAIEILSVSS